MQAERWDEATCCTNFGDPTNISATLYYFERRISLRMSTESVFVGWTGGMGAVYGGECVAPDRNGDWRVVLSRV